MAAIKSFDLKCGKHSKVLVLGSIPGVASLDAVQYYAHPRNAFWRIMADYFNFDVEESYDLRISHIVEQGVALWDVLRQCERNGSLDSAIKNETIVPNELEAWLSHEPSVRAILLNGGKAAQVFKKHFPQLMQREDLNVVALPSTSPAYAAMHFDEKKHQWHQVLRESLLQG